ncbi:MAG: DNRLRE domain-containing protein, partial [Candidatus Bathyarchaeia archaeon]
VEMEVTWNDYKTGSPWTTRGGDYTEEGASSSTVPNNPGVWMVWDVTSIVKAWIEGGQPNYGFLIKDQGEDANLYMSISFWSKEYSEVPNLQPTLKVDWSPPTTTINTITTTTTTTTATTTTPPSKRPPYPVGGVLTPVSKLAILAPYMALIGLAAVVALVVKKRKR